MLCAPLLLSFLSGCSYLPELFGSKRPTERRSIGGGGGGEVALPEAPERSEPRRQAALTPEDGIELVWEISADPVDEYVIRYGAERGALTETVRVKASEVERIDDDQHGIVNRYRLWGVPSDTILYLTLSAASEGSESEPSRIIEVEPARRGPVISPD